MADTYEKDLAQKSSLTTGDYIRVVGSDNVSYKQLVSDVAQKIIETYAGSSLAGKSQSVKAALDSLNSNWKTTAVEVTAGDNVVIDTNKSYKMGRLLFLFVKGHTSADISNAQIFTISGASINPSAFTFPIAIGPSSWTLDSVAYGYTGASSITARIENGKYFHIAQCFICQA